MGITHGENVIQEGEMVFDVKANDGSKFEMEHLHKMTMTEESPFYGMVFWWTGRYGKTVERKMTVFFDTINKSFLFVPKMSMNTVMTIDGQKTSEFVFDNTQAKKNIKFFYAPDAFTKEYLFTDEWEYPTPTACKWTTDLKRGGVSIWNWVGDYHFINNANKFELKTMDKVVQTPTSPFLWMGSLLRWKVLQQRREDQDCHLRQEGLPGCCRQQPMDRRLQALQEGRVRDGVWIPLQDQVDRPWRDHQGLPAQGLSS